MQKSRGAGERKTAVMGGAPSTSEGKCLLLLESMPQGVVEQDINGKVVAMNPAAERILGRNLTELVAGTPYDEKNPPLDDDGAPLPFLQQPAEIALRTGRSSSSIVMGVFNPREGRYRWVSASAMPLPAKNGDGPRGTYTFFDDITEKRLRQETERHFHETLEQRVAERTAELESANRRLLAEDAERRRAEDEVRQTEAQFRFLAENSTDIISRLTPEGVYLYVSPACRALLGYEPEEMIGQSAYEFFHPDDVPAITESHTAILDTPVVSTDAYRTRRKGGDYIWLEATSHAIRDAETRAVVEIQSSSRDLTQRRLAEGQLRALTAELAQAEDRERRRLAQALHDNLQQLLVAAKLTQAAVGIESIDPSERPNWDRIADLINQAIEASRSLTAELSPPILDGGLPETMRWLARWMAGKFGLEIELHVNDRVEASTGARLLLLQATRELLLNVAEHAGVRQAELTLDEAEGDLLKIIVADKGKGFDLAAPSPTDRPTGGFGLLGLRERLTRIGGSVEIDGAPGRGARVTLFAPRQLEPRTAPAALSKPAAAPPVAAAPSAGPAIRALIVDDHRIVREGFARLLAETSDISVVGQAQDGLQAIDLARNLHPDVVVMDITMPRMNGIEATRIIAAEQPDCRIIGLSAYSTADMEQAMIAAGAVAYVPKDGPPDALVAAIRAHARPAAAV